MSQTLTLTPAPRQLDLTEGSFRLDGGVRIQIGPTAGDQTRFAAESLCESLDEFTDLHLAVVPAGSPRRVRAISLILAGRDDAVFAAAGSAWASPAAEGPEGYTLAIDADGATIAANDEAGLFYAAQTLIQIARNSGRAWPGLRIADHPTVPHRGFLLDVTRGKVHRVDTILALIRRFAHHKCNHLQLYTEHAFDFPSEPAIGRGTGALTPDEVMALDRLCRQHHIELAPNVQSLGHQGHLLKLPDYEHLAETPWRFTFAAANEEVFTFIDRLYGDLVPCFTSRLLNVNADEPWDLGRGVSQQMTAEIGIGGVYLAHLRRLHELATKHGCRMAMWADVLKNHGDLIAELPDDVLLIDWWYEATDRYASLDALAASGREFWICAATSSWMALYPRLENAIANIRDYVREGVVAGASGVLISDWGDNGHDQLLSNSLYPFMWGAECAWTGATTPLEQFDAAFGQQILRDGSGRQVAALRRLGRAMQIERNWMKSWNSAMALYEDPIVGKIAGLSPPEVVAEASDAASELQHLLHEVQDADLRHDLGFVAFQVQFACDKVTATRAIQIALVTNAPLGDATAAIRRQRDVLPAMKAEFEQRWLASARPSSIQFNLDRYDRLIAQVDRAIAWLAGDRAAPYDPGDYAVLYEATVGGLRELEAIIGYDALPEDIKDYLRDVGGN